MNATVKSVEDTFISPTQLWTPEQTADVMDVHVSTLYRYISEGFPRPIKIGKRASRFIAAEVEAWIADRAAERRHTVSSVAVSAVGARREAEEQLGN